MIEHTHRSVSAWRPAPAGGLFLAGRTRRYAIEPAGSWVVGAITSGAMRAHGAGTELLFEPGDICVWPGDVAHRGEAAGGDAWEARLIIVDPEIGAALPRPTPQLLRDERLFHSFLDLHRGAEVGVAEEAEPALVEWLWDVSEPTAPDSPGRTPSRAVRLARELLDDQMGQPLSLDRLARAAGTDKFQLAKMFKRELGIAPHRYLIGRRLTAVQQSLASGASIADAAAAAGFFDQSHLHRHFTRRLGFTPAQFVRALKQ
jgi:AraC-like DNA-binding protein